MRRAFVFGTDRSVHHLVGAIVFGEPGWGGSGGAAPVLLSRTPSVALQRPRAAGSMPATRWPTARCPSTTRSGQKKRAPTVAATRRESVTDRCLAHERRVRGRGRRERDATADGERRRAGRRGGRSLRVALRLPGGVHRYQRGPEPLRGLHERRAALAERCSDGTCQCPTGTLTCSNKCVDPTLGRQLRGMRQRLHGRVLRERGHSTRGPAAGRRRS